MCKHRLPFHTDLKSKSTLTNQQRINNKLYIVNHYSTTDHDQSWLIMSDHNCCQQNMWSNWSVFFSVIGTVERPVLHMNRRQYWYVQMMTVHISVSAIPVVGGYLKSCSRLVGCMGSDSSTDDATSSHSKIMYMPTICMWLCSILERIHIYLCPILGKKLVSPTWCQHFYYN